MKASSRPKMPFCRRVYVLNETERNDKPKKAHDMVTMASGRLSNCIILAFGSAVDDIVGDDRVGSEAVSTRHDGEEQRCAASAYYNKSWPSRVTL